MVNSSAISYLLIPSLLFARSGVCPLFLVAFAAEDLHSSLEIVSNRLLLAMTALFWDSFSALHHDAVDLSAVAERFVHFHLTSLCHTVLVCSRPWISEVPVSLGPSWTDAVERCLVLTTTVTDRYGLVVWRARSGIVADQRRSTGQLSSKVPATSAAWDGVQWLQKLSQLKMDIAIVLLHNKSRYCKSLDDCNQLCGAS
jgi:hypothetical protein